MKKVILILLTLSFYQTKAQSITPEIVASSGEHFETAGVQLSWTLGEPVVETLGSSIAILTQGFHQSDGFISNIQEESNALLTIMSFPNPTNGMITFTASEPTLGNIYLSVYDMQGKLISQDQIVVTGTSFQKDLTEYNSGIYLIVIKDQTHNSKSFQLIKF